jgi:hypothetical protein
MAARGLLTAGRVVTIALIARYIAFVAVLVVNAAVMDFDAMRLHPPQPRR